MLLINAKEFVVNYSEETEFEDLQNCCVRKMKRTKVAEVGNVQIKKKRSKQKCDICDLWINGNNISNHRKLHSPPNIKCEKCDFLAYYQSQVDYHYNRKHVHQIKQGRPIGKRVKLGNSKPRIFSKKVLSDLKICDPSKNTQATEQPIELRSALEPIEQISDTKHESIVGKVTDVLDEEMEHQLTTADSVQPTNRSLCSDRKGQVSFSKPILTKAAQKFFLRRSIRIKKVGFHLAVCELKNIELSIMTSENNKKMYDFCLKI